METLCKCRSRHLPNSNSSYAHLRDTEGLAGYWYWEGQEAKMTAVPNEGYKFVKWVTNLSGVNVDYSTDNLAYYTMPYNDGTRPHHFRAIFEEQYYF